MNLAEEYKIRRRGEREKERYTTQKEILFIQTEKTLCSAVIYVRKIIY